MGEVDEDCSAVDWVIEHPQLVAVFQELGIDYCCPGKSLRYACGQAGVALDELLQRIHEMVARPS